MTNGGAPSYKDVLALGTNCLVDYLAVRGLEVPGTLVELVARTFAAAELNLPITESTEKIAKQTETRVRKTFSQLSPFCPTFS